MILVMFQVTVCLVCLVIMMGGVIFCCLVMVFSDKFLVRCLYLDLSRFKTRRNKTYISYLFLTSYFNVSSLCIEQFKHQISTNFIHCGNSILCIIINIWPQQWHLIHLMRWIVSYFQKICKHRYEVIEEFEQWDKLL